ncbi:hypothetical protein ACI65C_011570 [Semiaphis heraclei]
MFVSNIISTQDVNLSMFIYLVNHLTPQECVKLTAYLYAEGLEPTAAKELEQELPIDKTCLSLLMTWNNSAGKEKSFLSIANCLRKIKHEKLAEWLSDTVFTQLSMELSNSFLQNTTLQRNTATVSSRSRKVLQIESCPYDRNVLYLLFDTFCMYFILMAIVTFVFYSLSLLVQTIKESQNILNVYNSPLPFYAVGQTVCTAVHRAKIIKQSYLRSSSLSSHHVAHKFRPSHHGRKFCRSKCVGCLGCFHLSVVDLCEIDDVSDGLRNPIQLNFNDKFARAELAHS